MEASREPLNFEGQLANMKGYISFSTHTVFCIFRNFALFVWCFENIIWQKSSLLNGWFYMTDSLIISGHQLMINSQRNLRLWDTAQELILLWPRIRGQPLFRQIKLSLCCFYSRNKEMDNNNPNNILKLWVVQIKDFSKIFSFSWASANSNVSKWTRISRGGKLGLIYFKHELRLSVKNWLCKCSLIARRVCLI